MPKRKPYCAIDSVMKLGSKLEDDDGLYVSDPSEIAKRSMLPAWLIKELIAGKAIHEYGNWGMLDVLILDIIKFCYHDRNFLRSAIREIPLNRRNRVIYLEKNDTLTLRIEKLVEYNISKGYIYSVSAIKKQIPNILPKSCAALSERRLSNIINRARKRLLYRRKKRNKKPDEN